MVLKSSGESASPEADGRRLGGGAIASLIGVGLLNFMIQNTESVQLDFLVRSFTWPLWLLTMASAVLGALVWLGTGRNAPSSSSQGAPPRPSGLKSSKAPAIEDISERSLYEWSAGLSQAEAIDPSVTSALCAAKAARTSSFSRAGTPK